MAHCTRYSERSNHLDLSEAEVVSGVTEGSWPATDGSMRDAATSLNSGASEESALAHSRPGQGRQQVPPYSLCPETGSKFVPLASGKVTCFRKGMKASVVRAWGPATALQLAVAGPALAYLSS